MKRERRNQNKATNGTTSEARYQNRKKKRKKENKLDIWAVELLAGLRKGVEDSTLISRLVDQVNDDLGAVSFDLVLHVVSKVLGL